MNISKVENCAGCFLCAELCPKKCISIVHDKLGHTLPSIDENTCIDCGICAKACPEMTLIEKVEPQKVLASWDKDEKSRQKSSSGGLATAFAKRIIEQDGIVYGCAFTQPFNFEHIRCSTLEELEKLRGSKYVQSDTSKCLGSLRSDIKKGLKVLFIGTPCQVAAARRAVKNAENLYTIDLICHGVPSQLMLKDSLPKSVFSLPIDKVDFRENTDFKFSAKKGNQIIYNRELRKDWYLKGFFTAMYYRDSCYSCKYAGKTRCSDITLGDFWGVEEKLIDTNIENGLSLVMINTEKGYLLFDEIKNDVNSLERPLQEAVNGNKQLSKPMPRALRSKIFKFLYPYFGFKFSVFFSIPAIIVKNLLVKSSSKE